MIKNVQGSTSLSRNYALQEKTTAEQKKVLQEEDKVAIYEKSINTEKITYKKPQTKNVDYQEVNRLLAEAEKSYQGLRELVEKLISKQGKKIDDLLVGRDHLLIDDETRAEATAAIGEDGPWGVQAVSDRLVAFAKAISGNDQGKLEEIKNAIEKGFQEAERIFGGSLPEISYQTYEETMRKLDEWAAPRQDE